MYYAVLFLSNVGIFLDIQKIILEEPILDDNLLFITSLCAIVEDVRTTIQNHEGPLFIPNLNNNDQQANN